MDNTSERERILNSIREGLKESRFKQIEEPQLSNKELFVTSEEPLIRMFTDELTKISGHCFYLNNRDELIQKLNEIHAGQNLELCYCPDSKYKEIIEETQIRYTEKFESAESIKSGISSCEFLVARFGSVMVSSAMPGGRRVFSFPEIHIVIAGENQLVLELEEALSGMQQKYGDDLPSQITNITGPSRTADIEKTLILGAHGPKQLFVLVLKS